MITSTIIQPKVVIVASLLIGALAIAAFALRPDTGQQSAEQSGFGHRDAVSDDVPEPPRPSALAAGKVATQNQTDPDIAQVVEAFHASLRRNDLASAKVLLGAEQALYKNDPRMMALQAELEAREELAAKVHAVEQAVTSPAPATARSNPPALRFAERSWHSRSASSLNRERTNSRSYYAESRHTRQAEAAASSPATRDTSNPVLADPGKDADALRAAPPVADTALPSQSTAVPPPLTQAVQSAQTDPAPAPAPVASTPNQGPKTRDEVRMEVERARTDGALPRFGNPDPAGPGGAPSRVSHPVVLGW